MIDVVTIGSATIKYQLLYAYPFEMVKRYITIKRIFSIIKSIAIETKSLNLFIFEKTLNYLLTLSH